MLKNPDKSSPDQVALLERFIRDFPYCQTGHLLYAKALHEQGSLLFSKQLKITAVYAGNRKVLYELINGKPERPNNVASVVATASSDFSEAGKADTFRKQETAVKDQNKQTVTQDNAQPDLITSEKAKAVEKESTRSEKKEDPSEALARRLKELEEKDKTTKNNPVTGREEEVIQPAVEVRPNEVASDILSKEAHATEEIKEDQTEGSEKEVSNSGQTVAQTVEIPDEAVTEVVNDLPELIETNILAEAVNSALSITYSEAADDVEWKKKDNKLKEEQLASSETDVPSSPGAEIKPGDKNIEAAGKKSFTEWLRATKSGSVTKEEVKASSAVEEKSGEKSSSGAPEKDPANASTQKEEMASAAKFDLIDRFIQLEPRITPPKKAEFYSPANKAKQSVTEDEEIVTETLAKIYALQGNHQKAIRAYETLSLKYPEKSSYFAGLISDLKKTISNNNKNS